MDKVWLVTGSASGLGRNIAEAVLESGERRNIAEPGVVNDDVETPKRIKRYLHGGLSRAFIRHVKRNRADALAESIYQVIQSSWVARCEQLSAERFKAVIDTNFYGVVNVTRAAVPHMRKQRSGCILQISSVGAA